MSSLLVVVQTFSDDPKINKPLSSDEFFINFIDEKMVSNRRFEDFKKKAVIKTKGANYAVVSSTEILPI